MLLVPLGMQTPVRHRPLVSAILAGTLLYQTILLGWFPQMRINPASFLEASLGELSFYTDFFLGLFRGAGLLGGLLLVLFLLICGPLLEERARPSVMAMTFLGGAAVPLFLARAEWFLLDAGYWPGLGGVMACIGLAYYKIWEDDIKSFYFFLLPPKVGIAGISTIFLLMIMHALIPLSQYMGRPPGTAQGISTTMWLFLLPFPVLIVCLISRGGYLIWRRGEGVAGYGGESVGHDI